MWDIGLIHDTTTNLLVGLFSEAPKYLSTFFDTVFISCLTYLFNHLLIF